MKMNESVHYETFAQLDIRVGTIIEAKVFEAARNPAYILRIDFGEEGILKSSAQITKLYSLEDLIGTQIVAVINFPPKQIATIQSQCLVLGAVNSDQVTLLSPLTPVDNGTSIS